MFKKLFNNPYAIFSLYCLLILMSSTLFSIFESRAFLDSVWWAFITATTIGYGDIYALTLGGRVVTIVLSHLCVFVIAPAIVTILLSKLIENKNEFTHTEQEEIKKLLTEIKNNYDHPKTIYRKNRLPL